MRFHSRPTAWNRARSTKPPRLTLVEFELDAAVAAEGFDLGLRTGGIHSLVSELIIKDGDECAASAEAPTEEATAPVVRRVKTVPTHAGLAGSAVDALRCG